MGAAEPRAIGLAGYSETVVFAQDHQVAKPDKGIFEVVERRARCGAGRVRAGGRPSAQRRSRARSAPAGVAVWLDRDGTGACDVDEAPDAVVRSLDDLAGVLERLR